jgi:hypothetical protein
MKHNIDKKHDLLERMREIRPPHGRNWLLSLVTVNNYKYN